MRHEPAVHRVFPARGVLHPDRDGGQQPLEITRRREEIAGGDLAQVVLHRRLALRTVHAEPGPERLAHGKDEVAHPCHRQIGEHAVAGRQPVELGRGPRGLDDVAVRQHHALGLAGGAGGVEHDAGVVRAQRRDPHIELGPEPRLRRPPLRLQVRQRGQPRVVVTPQPARVEIDDPVDPPDPVGDLQDLVDLLLVLGHDDPRAAMVEHIGHLVGHCVLVERHRNRLAHARRNHRPVERRPIAADHREMISRPQPEVQEPQRDRPHLDGGLGPGPALPDPELLLAPGRPLPVQPDIARQKRGKRYGRRSLRRRDHAVLPSGLAGPVRRQV